MIYINLIYVILFILIVVLFITYVISNKIAINGGFDQQRETTASIEEFANQTNTLMKKALKTFGGTDYYLIAGPALIMHGLRKVEKGKNLIHKINDLDAYVENLPKQHIEKDLDGVTVDLHNESLAPKDNPFWSGLEKRMRTGEYEVKHGVKFMTLEMLLEMKEHLNRPKDQQDIQLLKDSLGLR